MKQSINEGKESLCQIAGGILKEQSNLTILLGTDKIHYTRPSCHTFWPLETTL